MVTRRVAGTAVAVAALLVPAPTAPAGAQESQAVVNGSPRAAQLSSQGLYPHLASRSTGAQAVVWEETTGEDRVIHFSERRPGRVWSEPVPLSKPGMRAERPKVALGPGGRVAVVWFQGEGTDTDIVVASRTAGSWATMQVTDDATSNYDPELEYDAQGRLVVLWFDHSAGSVESVRLVPDGAKPAVTTVWQAPAGHLPYRPRLDVNPAGEAVAVWADRHTSASPATVGHRMATMTADGTWGPSVPVGQSTQETVLKALHASAVIDTAGVASVVTVVGSDEASPVQVTRRSRSGDISTTDVGRGHVASVAVDGADVLTAAWARPEGRVRTKELRRGAWTRTTAVPRSSAADLRLASTASGSDSVSYVDADGALHVAHRGANTTTWSRPQQLLAPSKAGFPFHGMVKHGNDLSVVAWPTGPGLPAGPILTRTVDRTRPAARLVSPKVDRRVTAGRFTVRWRGTDVWSTPVKFTVQRKVADGRWRKWASTRATSKTANLTRDKRQCFRVRARDASANVSRWSAAGCVVRR